MGQVYAGIESLGVGPGSAATYSKLKTFRLPWNYAAARSGRSRRVQPLGKYDPAGDDARADEHPAKVRLADKPDNSTW